MSKNCPVCGNPVGTDDAACPSCGYKLLGTTQRFAPVTMAGEEVPAPRKASGRAMLRVVRGPQTGMAFALRDAPLSVGRSPQCDVFLNDMTVSRQHATISRTGAGYVITDEHSFNGVWVNNASAESHVLREGDVVQIGAFCLLYQEE